ncbi:MAG: hypothetical protein ACM31L_01675 [Actinomycetota bacterium]
MSFPKLLLTVAVIAIIWFGFKYMARVAEIRAREGRRPPAPGPARREPDNADGVQDMVRCPACNTWQPARGAKPCGRSDCPY